MSKIHIYNEDYEIGMLSIDDGSVDMILTSPPYDNLRDYNSNIDKEYLIKQSYRVLKDGGVMIIIIDDQTIKGSKTLSSFDYGIKCKENGFRIHDVMIWEKETFTDTGSLKVRYGNVFEYIIVASKGKPKSFNPLKDRKNKSHGDVIHGTVRKKDGSTKEINNKGKKINEFGQRFNVWKINTEKNNKTGHPAVFPKELSDDLILSWTNSGDLVLDMFSGSGTTALSCLSNNRNFIGFEIDEIYYNNSIKRIERTE